MTKRRSRAKPKPKSPQQIAAEKAAREALQRAQDFEAVSLPPGAAFLDANGDIVVRRASQQTVEGARRADAFDALKDGMEPGAYDAARRLETDMRKARNEADKGRGTGRVDNGQLSLTSDQQIAASKRVEKVLARVGPRDARLLQELIYPTVQRGNWRAVVAHFTGEQNSVAQAAAVRSACANLALAYCGREAA